MRKIFFSSIVYSQKRLLFEIIGIMDFFYPYSQMFYKTVIIIRNISWIGNTLNDPNVIMSLNNVTVEFHLFPALNKRKNRRNSSHKDIVLFFLNGTRKNS